MAIGTPSRAAAGKGGRVRLPSHLHWPDLRISLVIWLVCGWLFWLTTRFEKVAALLAQNIQPSWFPRLLIGTIFVLSLILPFEHLFMEAGKERLDEHRKARIEPISLLTAALLCAVVLAISYLGTFLAMVLVSAALPVLWGERVSMKLVLFVVLFPATVAVVFTQVLQVYFDPGVMGLLFR